MAEASPVEQMVRNALASLMRVTPDRLSLDATLDQLGVDSVMAMALVIELEDALGLTVPLGPDGPLHGTRTIREVAARFERLVGQRAQPDTRQ
jgi:acyl carrier protein